MQHFSRSKTIFVKLAKLGRNYLPFIKELESNVVKYIDIQQSFIDFDGNDIIETVTSGAYITLLDRYGNMFYDNVDIVNFTPGYFLGQRKLIDRKLILQNCFIECPTSQMIGEVVALTFYWDEVKFSSPISSEKTYKDYVELLLAPSQSRTVVTRIKFPDIRNIAGKKIRSIRPQYLTGQTVTPLGYNTLPQNSDVQSSVYLTLANGNTILVDSLNLLSMMDVYQLTPMFFDNLLINFPDSYITVVVQYGESATLPTETLSIPLQIEYLEDKL